MSLCDSDISKNVESGMPPFPWCVIPSCLSRLTGYYIFHIMGVLYSDLKKGSGASKKSKRQNMGLMARYDQL